jgi:uncharacterized Rmd1/YagE family protein
MKVQAFQIADSIDIKKLKTVIDAKLTYSDSDELFYTTEVNQYVYILQYGVVCFLDYTENQIHDFLEQIRDYSRNFVEIKHREEFIIEPNSNEIIYGYNKISITSDNVEWLRIIMLNVGQSVALDYYSEQATLLMAQTNHQTEFLEKKGRMDISGRKLKKFIGKTLNLKNAIAENLYIFDSPPETWEDENLSKIDWGMKKTFDLQIRYRNLQQDLQIVKENLELFKDIMQHTHSNVLEWIIIILILIEILDLFIGKIFH